MRAKQSSNKTTKTTAKKTGIEKRWYAYAIAGAGAVAAAPQAHANIVYTASGASFTGNTSTTGSMSFQLDSVSIPNEGGFTLSTNVTSGSSGALYFSGIGTDAAKILLANHTGVLFNAGSLIGAAGAGQSYLAANVPPTKPIEALQANGDHTDFFGLEFNFGGVGPNYGWVEVERNLTGVNTVSPSETVTVIAYAYDTTAGEAIQAGQGAPTPEPTTASLMLLGLGAAGFQAWRKRKQARQAA